MAISSFGDFGRCTASYFLDCSKHNIDPEQTPYPVWPVSSLFVVQNEIEIKISKTCVERPLSKRPKMCLQYQLSLNAGQKYCRMIPFRPSLSCHLSLRSLFCLIFEWPFYTGLTVMCLRLERLEIDPPCC